ncbi:M48 family metallopeptidase [Microvirga alba]|uniref:M48 family metallopeptidase n=1 Tax=Microvirga alba TaxID=2791025 RepID=A0A931FSX8_9HYPH|nr:M48 family metallopeptidase [Microvirga alba]MBF9234156.1 M48 family metallopeptidase [Microvirga alba]
MLPAFGLYTQIAANRRRSTFLIGGLFVLFYLLAFALALLVRAGVDEAGALADLIRSALYDSLWLAPFASAAVALWVWIGFRINEVALGLLMGAKLVTRTQDARLYNLLENLCLSRGMAVPRLRITETSALNAFAAGVRPEQYTITVTRGLLDTLDDAEIEAVLAHELTHIRNGDVRLMIIAVFVVGVMSFIGELVFRWIGNGPRLPQGSEKSKNSGQAAAVILALVCIVLAWGLSRVIRFTLSRQREYLADAGAVELTRNPDAMISALLKIDGHSDLEGAPSGIMEMCLDNPRRGLGELFATHPSIEKRIEALVRAGGRRPAAQNMPAMT